MTTNCTLLSQTAINGIKELGSNALLLCNKSVQAKEDVRLTECRKQLKELKAEKGQSFKSLEKEVSEIKKAFTAVFISETSFSNDLELCPLRENVKLRQKSSTKESSQRDRHEQDMQEVLKVLNHLEVKAQTVDLKRIGMFRSERSRTIIIKVSNVWEKRLILSSVAKLRSFERHVFVSRELTPSEARLELESLKRRKKLIDEGTDRRLSQLRLRID